MKINRTFIIILAFSILIVYANKVNALEVNASTPLEANKNYNYVPGNLIDRSISSAWCTNGKLVPSLWISLKYPKPTQLTGIGFINGYARNMISFTNNARPKELFAKVEGKEPVKIELADSPELQWIEIGPITGMNVKFDIKAIYPGLISRSKG